MAGETFANVDAFIGHIMRALTRDQLTLLLRIVDAKLANASTDTLVQNSDPGNLGELFQRGFVDRDIDNPNKSNVRVQNLILSFRGRNPDFPA